MAKRKITWTDIAKNDLKETLEFYNKRNGNKIYSKKLLSKIRETVSLLYNHPLIGKISDDKHIRVLSVEGFQIYYEIHDLSISILIVWDTRRDPGDLNKILSQQ